MPDIRRPRRMVLVAVLVAVFVAAAVTAPVAAPKKPLQLRKVGFRVASDVHADAAAFALTPGDFDGDGVGDLAVGAPCDASGGAGTGAVYVLYGPITPGRSLGEADGKLLGGRRGDFAGETLAAVDLDGDGDDELAAAEDLVQQLVDAGRWTEESGHRLVDDVAAGGPSAGVR